MANKTALGDWRRDIRAHSHPIPAPSSATSAGRKGEPNHTAASATGTITEAERMRRVSPLERGVADDGGELGEFAGSTQPEPAEAP